MKTISAACLAFIFCVIFAGCTGTSQEGDGQIPAPVETTGVPAAPDDSADFIADSNNNFAFSLYKTLAAENPDDKNIFYSPYSISSAFALVYEGAKGTTGDEIRSVFFFPQSMDTLREGYFLMNKGINEAGSAYSLSVANALWAEKTYPFLDSYIKTANEYYSANTTNLDFINRPEESRLIINEWSEDKTKGKIQDLIPDGMIDPLTRLVITNAVYFKGEWVKQFDANETHEADFFTPSGVVKVEMMQRTGDDAVFGYYESETFKALKMPYESDDKHQLSMTVILPGENSLNVFEESLDAETLSEIENSLESGQVRVFLPKFKLETEYSLADTLKNMGMPVAFSNGADFSGMDGTKNLFISDVVHKAYVDVNEEGTEAAAATAVAIRLTAVVEEDPVPLFLADHPFIFLIQEDDTGNILFMGKVLSPAPD